MQVLPHCEFFGDPVIQRKVGEFAIVETRFGSQTSLPQHSHDDDVIIIMAHGARRDRCGDRILECPPGSVMLHSADVPHQNYFVGPAANVVINLVVPKWLREQYLSDLAASSRLPLLLAGESNLLAARIEFELRLADDLSESSIQELVIEFADRVTLSSAKKRIVDQSPWIADILEYLDSAPAESYRLAEIAERVDRHPAHIARTFREAVGCTIGTYLRRVRVTRACSLLAKSSKSIVEIAAEAGFTDQSHLSRCVQAVFGFSPGKYRKIVGQTG